jgi:hypothetical protein
VSTNLLAAAAFTVSVCVAAVNGLSAAVNTGLPASVSLHVKLALLAPLAIVTLVRLVVPFRNWPAGELVVRFTVWVLVAVATLLYASSNCTVIVPDVTPAVKVCADGVSTSLLAAAAVTVSVCVAAVNGVSAAVSTGLPASVSLYVKLALLAPLAIVTLVRLVVPFRNWPAVELVVKFTVCVLVAVATLLYASSNCTVIVPDVTPAVNVCADGVSTNLLAAAAFTVSVCVAAVNGLSAAVNTGLPASVSLYVKLALLAPLAIVTLVRLVVPFRNWPAPEVVVKITVWVLVAVAGLL